MSPYCAIRTLTSTWPPFSNGAHVSICQIAVFCGKKACDAHSSSFPTSHYHGITVTISFAGITEEMRKILVLLSVDLTQISDFADRQDFYMVRANETVRHIFSELYTVQEHIKPS